MERPDLEALCRLRPDDGQTGSQQLADFQFPNCRGFVRNLAEGLALRRELSIYWAVGRPYLVKWGLFAAGCLQQPVWSKSREHGPVHYETHRPTWDWTLFVEVGRLLKLGIAVEVVLYPKLRASPLQECVDRHSRRACLLLIELESRHTVQGALLRIVIEIA